jgi:hypothetical protein
VPNITEIDIVLDDLCRMDFVAYFINLRNIVLINQGISEVEVNKYDGFVHLT